MTAPAPRPGEEAAAELIAEALHYEDLADSKDAAESWDEMPDEWREPYRTFALEALSAAYPVIAAAVRQETLDEAAALIEARLPSIPVLSDPARRTRIIERSTLNRAASAVRALRDQ